jgi:hypothetical protein
MPRATTQTADIQASAAATLEPEITELATIEPVLNDEGLLELPDEQFENFTAPANTPLPTDIKHLLKKGVNTSTIEFEWKIFDRTDEAVQRGFTIVRPNLHGKFFADPAKTFDKKYQAVIRNVKGGKPELILCARSAKWAERERELSLKASQKNTPDNAEKMQELYGGIVSGVGAGNFQNNTFVTSMKWGAGSKN